MMTVINPAKVLVRSYLAAENIHPTDVEIERDCTKSYYKILSIPRAEVTAESVAAVALESREVRDAAQVSAAREFYFPSMPLEFENFSIKEIEEAERDMLWRMP